MNIIGWTKMQKKVRNGKAYGGLLVSIRKEIFNINNGNEKTENLERKRLI